MLCDASHRREHVDISVLDQHDRLAISNLTAFDGLHCIVDGEFQNFDVLALGVIASARSGFAVVVVFGEKEVELLGDPSRDS